jgi:hypothetical protein
VTVKAQPCGASRMVRAERRPGDGASHPRSSARRWPGSQDSGHEGRISRVPSVARTRESIRRGTKAQERRPNRQRWGPPPTCAREARVHSGATDASQSCCRSPGNGGRGRAPRGVRSPPGSARGSSGRRFDASSPSRSSVRRPPGESDAKGREAWGAAERGHGQDASSENAPAGAWTRLAAGARERSRGAR